MKIRKRTIISCLATLLVLFFTNKYWLSYTVQNTRHFEIEIFIIILVLSFLFFCKLADYAADFKSIKNKSRLDIVFLIIFFILLFIPMSKINQDTLSRDENRTLAVWKPLIKEEYRINYNFGNDFNNWFNDRFYKRKLLISTYQKLRYFLAYEIVESQGAFLNKRTHWVFNKVHIMPYSFVGNKNTENEIAYNLNKFGDFCKENGIKLYIFIVPYQGEIYYEKAAPYYYGTSVKKVNDAVFRIKSNVRYPFIWAYDDLKKASEEDYAYFKTDHHWTDFGAFAGSRVLLGEIQKDYPAVKIPEEKDYNISYNKKVRSNFDRKFNSGRSIHSFFPILKKSKSFLDTDYRYYDHKNQDLLKYEIIDIPQKRQKIFYPYLYERSPARNNVY